MAEKGERVAVAVHNNVIKDARVRKEVRTLVEKGYKVDVYGVTTEPQDTSDGIEGCNSFSLVDLSDTTSGIGLQYGAYQKLHRALVFAKKSINKARGILRRHRLVSLILAFAAGAVISRLPWEGVAALSVFLILALAAIFSVRTHFSEWFHRVNRRARYERIAAALGEKLSRVDYSYVHCHDLIALIAGVKYKKRRPKTCLIWDAHELYEEVNYAHGGEKRYINGLISKASSHVDRFITISESFKRIYAERYPALPSASVVMNATWPSTFLPSGSESPLRKHVGIADEQKILLFQGGFAPNRGIGMLLESAHDLPDDWTLMFMGWGKLEKQILDTSAALNKSREAGKPAIQVVPPASQEDLQEWTSGATLGVIPYENNSMNHLYCTPNKLWEYPNAGVPILATDLIEMGKMIRAWDIGTLLPRDFSASDVLSALANIKEEDLSRWRKNCEKFSSEMSWSKFEPALLEAYQ